MPRFNIAIALSVAFVLIIGALVVRVGGPNNSTGLLVLEDRTAPSYPGNAFDSVFGQASTTSGVSNLSTTDVVSRQLFADLVNLSSSGTVDSNSINSLASKYVDEILKPGVHQRVSESDVRTVPDSSTSLEAYGNAVFAMKAKYRQQATAYTERVEISDINSPAFRSAMEYFANLYQKAAEELQRIPVPTSLTSVHIQLINHYFSSSSSVSTIANLTSDPIAVYAAFTTYDNNSNQEDFLYGNIRTMLISKGIVIEIS